MANVIIDRVGKIYPNGFVAMHEANFEVPDGSFTVLVGPSGCGKTTLLRMIAGLELISNGEIRIDGKRVNEVPSKNRDIAMVFQDYALYPHMTVYENMAYALKLRSLPRDEIKNRVDSAAEMLELNHTLDRKPAQLSGGQRQRVALGRAIVRNPKVFLFDEPLSNLDAKLRVQMRSEISRLHNRLKATMIYVTHDQVEAMTMADMIVVLKGGYIQQIAPPLELYSQPKNLFVAGFIGSPPMNFMNVSLENERRLSGDGFSVGATEELTKLAVMQKQKELTLGIRPEDIHDRLSRIDAPPDRIVSGVVEVVEPMGSEVFVSARISSNLITARFRGDLIPEVGSRIELVFDMTRAHLFDKESGARLVE